MKPLAWAICAGLSLAQQPPRPPASYVAAETIPLWDTRAPGAQGDAETDRPTLTVFRAISQETGTAVIIAPGGGYGNLAFDKEGTQVAAWFNAQGVTAFVLKYRLGPRYRHPIELGDARQAIRLVRSRAAQYGLQPNRIGMMGFSAGGHLAATAATKFEADTRPDFLILAYPVISFDPAITHAGSVRNLVGDNPSEAVRQDLSAELHVTANTPPTFLFHTSNDNAVPVENTVRFYLAMRQAKVPAEMHIFENGPHGVGLILNDPSLGAWPGLLTNWLRARGLLTK
jgi:acetyl esterase/lipase